MINLPTGEITERWERYRLGDLDERFFFTTLFKTSEPCLRCGDEIGHHAQLAVRADLGRPGMDLIGAVCRRCANRPDRTEETAKIFDAVFEPHMPRRERRRLAARRRRK